MNDKQLATDACNNTQKERIGKVYGVYVEALIAAEGKPYAAELGEQARQRFKAGLNVLKAAHIAAQTVIDDWFPQT
jgi:hypothetical protein